MDPATQNEEYKSRDESKLKKIKRSKKLPSARFFDLDTSGDSVSLATTKEKKLAIKAKKLKKLQNKEVSPKWEKIKKEGTKKRRANQGQIDIDFKKQERKINLHKKAMTSASIDETIQEVIETAESGMEAENDSV